ncbi:MAG: hypothetical protein KA020_06095 [Planctomycetes bacterium]|jgi:hypothetical protein|nr:hypothetical protein [Planctomycetota bacterium]MCC7061570.1 hypothetical protein [Planctomycetota bacterium]
MRKLVASVAVCVAAFSLTSCLAGPHQLRRSVDDWDQKMYVNSPWLDAVLWVVPVFQICGFGASIGDFFVGDAYAFWFHDAWDGKGTGFKHAETAPTDGYVNSFLGEGGFMKVSK